MKNAWKRPLVFCSQAAMPRPQSFVRPTNIPFSCQFVRIQMPIPSAQPTACTPCRLLGPPHSTILPLPNLSQLPLQCVANSKNSNEPSRRTTFSCSEAETDDTTLSKPRHSIPEKNSKGYYTPTYPPQQNTRLQLPSATSRTTQSHNGVPLTEHWPHLTAWPYPSLTVSQPLNTGQTSWPDHTFP